MLATFQGENKHS